MRGGGLQLAGPVLPALNGVRPRQARGRGDSQADRGEENQPCTRHRQVSIE